MSLLKGIVAFSLTWATAGMVALPAHGETKDPCKEIKGKAKSSACAKQVRSLASLAPESQPPVGQGEAMLNTVTSPSPRFLRQNSGGSGPVKLAGVCRATDGVVYHTGEKGYSDCLDSATGNTGSQSDLVNAQRQAGVGVLVGK